MFVPGCAEPDGAVSEAFFELGKHAHHLLSFEFYGLSQDSGAFEAISCGAPLLQDVRLHFLDDLNLKQASRGRRYEERGEGCQYISGMPRTTSLRDF